MRLIGGVVAGFEILAHPFFGPRTAAIFIDDTNPDRVQLRITGTGAVRTTFDTLGLATIIVVIVISITTTKK